jgi:hypothetical protein
MRLILSGTAALVAAVLVAPAGNAFAPKPPDYTPASATFRDAEGDAIRSDRLGPYTDGGSRGLEVHLFTCADCSQDLTIGTFRSGRTLTFDYRNKVAGSGSGPLGTMSDNAFVNIRDIAAMMPGETKITRASFNSAVGYFRWLSGPAPTHGSSLLGQSYGSQAVEVTRSYDAPPTWTVSTPSTPVWYPGDYYAGDLAVLLKDAPKNTLASLGLYHMPFGLTVTCENCP